MKKDDLLIQYADEEVEPFFDVVVIAATVLIGCVFAMGYMVGKVLG